MEKIPDEINLLVVGKKGEKGSERGSDPMTLEKSKLSVEGSDVSVGENHRNEEEVENEAEKKGDRVVENEVENEVVNGSPSFEEKDDKLGIIVFIFISLFIFL